MTRTMRAARFHGPAIGIRMEEVPYPMPGAGDVVVRLAACGICGSDVHFLEGMPVPGGLPITLGHEPAGIVETVDANVHDWRPGDRVAVHLGVGCGGLGGQAVRLVRVLGAAPMLSSSASGHRRPSPSGLA